MERVLIQSLPREGLTHRPRAGRFWPSEAPVAVEIVESAESPTIEVTQRNPHTNVQETVSKPDPHRINRKDYEAIKADPVLRIMSDGETISVLSQAALDAARKQASDLAGKLVDAESAKAEAGARLTSAQAEVAALRVRVAELEAAAKAGGETPPGGDVPPAPGGKGGKAK